MFKIKFVLILFIIEFPTKLSFGAILMIHTNNITCTFCFTFSKMFFFLFLIAETNFPFIIYTNYRSFIKRRTTLGQILHWKIHGLSRNAAQRYTCAKSQSPFFDDVTRVQHPTYYKQWYVANFVQTLAVWHV